MLQGHSGQNNQLTDWYDVSWRSANKIKRKKKLISDIYKACYRTDKQSQVQLDIIVVEHTKRNTEKKSSMSELTAIER